MANRCGPAAAPENREVGPAMRPSDCLRNREHVPCLLGGGLIDLRKGAQPPQLEAGDTQEEFQLLGKKVAHPVLLRGFTHSVSADLPNPDIHATSMAKAV